MMGRKSGAAWVIADIGDAQRLVFMQQNPEQTTSVRDLSNPLTFPWRQAAGKELPYVPVRPQHAHGSVLRVHLLADYIDYLLQDSLKREFGG